MTDIVSDDYGHIDQIEKSFSHLMYNPSSSIHEEFLTTIHVIANGKKVYSVDIRLVYNLDYLCYLHYVCLLI